MSDKCKVLAYVQGNDVLLKLWLWELTTTGGRNGRMSSNPFPLEETEDLTVIVVGTKQETLSFSMVQDEENCLAVELPHTLPVGTYSICIRCKLRGRSVRSYESPVFQVVSRNNAANITFERIGDTRQAEYSMEFQMVPSAVARGANAYELWLEQGHEGSIDDFLDYYIATLATEQEDGLMSHEDKKKLDDLPSSTELESKLNELDDAIGDEQRRAEQAEQTLGGAISTEAAAREAADTTLSGAINSEAAAREAADNALGGRATELEGRVSGIEGKISQQASAQNQLADKDFVNSSISTATAEFKGTYNSLAELEQVEANMNDYAFVVGQDAAGNTVYSRYKYVGQTRGSSWAFEFNLNNSSFTAAQWAAINSAITSGDVEKLAALPTKQQLDLLFSGKQDVISDLATIRSGAARGATALQTETDPTVPSWAKQSTKPSYTPQEVGALPANTPLFDGDYNSLTNKPDLSGYITISVNNLVNYYLKSETYTKQEVQGLIAAIQQFHYEIFASTSDVTSPQGNVLYLIGPTGTGTDKYEEYVYDATKQEPWVKIGDTSIDLSGYYTSQQTDAAIASALNTALADYTTTAALTLLLAGKQDVINDLSDIRSGARAGATAYQKPQGGIPSTDMSQSVQESLGKADSSLQPAQQTLTDAQKQQARNNIGAAGVDDVPTLPHNVSYFSGDDGDGIVPTDGIRGEDIVASSAISVTPDVVTAITGDIGSATTITLVVPNDNLRHVWDMFFTTASDGGATIVVPQGATLHVPSGYSIASGKTYEVRIIGVGNHYYLTCQEYN